MRKKAPTREEVIAAIRHHPNYAELALFFNEGLPRSDFKEYLFKSQDMFDKWKKLCLYIKSKYSKCEPQINNMERFIYDTFPNSSCCFWYRLSHHDVSRPWYSMQVMDNREAFLPSKFLCMYKRGDYVSNYVPVDDVDPDDVVDVEVGNSLLKVRLRIPSVVTTIEEHPHFTSLKEYLQSMLVIRYLSDSQRALENCTKYIQLLRDVSNTAFTINLNVIARHFLGLIYNSPLSHNRDYRLDNGFKVFSPSNDFLMVPIPFMCSINSGYYNLTFVVDYIMGLGGLIYNPSTYSFSCSSTNVGSQMLTAFIVTHSLEGMLTPARSITASSPVPREGYIRSYSTRVETVIPGVTEDIVKNKSNFIIGLEIECNYTSRDSLSYVHTEFSNYMIMKADGSLGSDGVELVTKPDTPAMHRKTLLDFIQRGVGKFNAYNDPRCGMHIHINRGAFTEVTLGKFIKFFYAKENEKFIQDIAQRQFNTYCFKNNNNNISDDKLSSVYNKETQLTYSLERKEYTTQTNVVKVNNKFKMDRGMLNLTGEASRGTMEIRIFKSNLSRVSLLAKIDFVESLYYYIQECSYNKLDWKSYIMWLDTKAEYNYLKTFISKRPKLFGEVYKDAAGRERHKGTIFTNPFRNMERKDGTEIDDIPESKVEVPNFKLKGAM